MTHPEPMSSGDKLAEIRRATASRAGSPSREGIRIFADIRDPNAARATGRRDDASASFALSSGSWRGQREANLIERAPSSLGTSGGTPK